MARTVTRSEFEEALAASPTSLALEEHYNRFSGLEDLMDIETVVHDGNLVIEGSWRVPGFCTLVTGNLTIADTLDLKSTYGRGGLFVVTGDVSCRHLLGSDDLTGFIDGDLVAKDAIIAGFDDAILNVIGTLTTRLLIGGSAAVHVGAGAVVEYGTGGCSPIGELGAPPIRAKHDEAATAKRVTAQTRRGSTPFDAERLADLIREGKGIFR